MNFTNTPPEWQNAGAEPSGDIIESGFQPGYKPPAAFFNWFWNRVSGCLKELQEKLTDLDNNKMDESFNYKDFHWVNMTEVFDSVYQLEQTIKNKVEPLESYDTAPCRIGTWIDGSTPVYRRVIPLTAVKQSGKIDIMDALSSMLYSEAADASGLPSLGKYANVIPISANPYVCWDAEYSGLYAADSSEYSVENNGWGLNIIDMGEYSFYWYAIVTYAFDGTFEFTPPERPLN